MERDTVRSLARGAVGFLLAAAYAVAVVTSLSPPAPLVGARLGLAVAAGLSIAGLLAAGWVGVDAGRGRLSVRRVATFVVTGWVVLLPLGAAAGATAAAVGTGLAGEYAAQCLALLAATASAGWMAYGGGWERARSRMGSGGLDRM